MTLEWTEPAVLDLESIRDYIAKDSAYYAERFVARSLKLPKLCRTIPAWEGSFLKPTTRSSVNYSSKIIESSIKLCLTAS
jgi:hypothetical protein